jgi:hypothetical protein
VPPVPLPAEPPPLGAVGLGSGAGAGAGSDAGGDAEELEAVEEVELEEGEEPSKPNCAWLWRAAVWGLALLAWALGFDAVPFELARGLDGGEVATDDAAVSGAGAGSRA